MVRYIPMGNGKILVSFNNDYNLTDFYFSKDMAENHSAGKPFRYGVSINDKFTWINASNIVSKDYYDHTMIGIVKYNINDVSFEDDNFVDIYEDVYARKIKITNKRKEKINVKLFFHQNFSIYGNNIGDTGFYYPDTNAIVHYKGRRYFIISTTDGKNSFDQYAIGIKDFNGMAGTWKDAEDNNLSMGPIAIGSVDSTIRHSIDIDPESQKELYYYIACARDLDTVLRINRNMSTGNLDRMMKRTENFWELWVSKSPLNLTAELNEMYKKSLFIIRSHINEKGAVMASSDSDILRSNMDSYYYSWPRDAGYAAISMIVSEHSDPAKLFFDFCINTISKDGYFYHKYNPDGKIASSWLPYIMDGKRILPIQEDESAIVIIAAWYYYSTNNDIEYISYLYERLIKRVAEFLYNFTYDNGLPKESFDLWEERFGIHTYTVASVYIALIYAANFAEIFNETDLARKYKSKADKMLESFEKMFYSDDLGYYARRIYNGDVDFVLDSSVLWLVIFGIKKPDDPRIVSTVKAIEKKLWVPGIGGIARYEGDYYQRISGKNIPGNPWIITTLWLADYYIMAGNTGRALELINWVVQHSEESGILSEQINPDNGEPISVSPLIWSHSQLVLTLKRYKDAIKNKGIQ
ncbi:glycoside hydrolase family 15 protein [Picrophilus oshimae]|uniref:Glucoamylase n=1 Tax=Picrophilus torridus (strain ATCC 700027 / DSM 9790 / JCM 10055 / NBRC 100828 / KAW 2/3) TaxID=1122961 RepID=Q6KYX5_PICTO|nr:glycoside hydrolase family 15 protein [Picrophilus oshimae]AAT44077.1 glucoamylase [Picrophilus oshimae DSM 9789]